MIKEHILVLTSLLLFTRFSSTYGNSVLSIKLLKFINDGNHDEKGSCCDLFCSSNCDSTFFFCIDRLSGSNTNFKSSCKYKFLSTGEFRNQKSIDFKSSMNSLANPFYIKLKNGWPGGIKFKVSVMDDDSPYSNHDGIDKMSYDFRQSASPSKETSTSKFVRLRGQRQKDKTTLEFEIMVWCEENYYGPSCVFCKARDDKSGHYTCNPKDGSTICLTGWEKPELDCTIRKDDCIDDSCMNNSTCIDKYMDYECLCEKGFEGTNCEENIDECGSSPCQNGALCIDGIDGYTCKCSEGYIGNRCEYHKCQNASHCDNNGTCVGNGDCFCTPGFEGKNCEIVKCDVINCQNDGECIDGECFCSTGYHGSFCSVDICEHIICHNGGKCSEGDCQCLQGYEGMRCEKNVDDCEGVKCNHEGTCIDRLNSFKCDCLPQYIGTLCEESICDQNKSEMCTIIINEPPQMDVHTIYGNQFYWFPLLIAVSIVLVIILILVTLVRKYKHKIKLMWRRHGNNDVANAQGYANPAFSGNSEQNACNFTASSMNNFSGLDNHNDNIYCEEPIPNKLYHNNIHQVNENGAVGSGAFSSTRRDNLYDNSYPSSSMHRCNFEPPPSYEDLQNEIKQAKFNELNSENFLKPKHFSRISVASGLYEDLYTSGDDQMSDSQGAPKEEGVYDTPRYFFNAKPKSELYQNDEDNFDNQLNEKSMSDGTYSNIDQIKRSSCA